MKVLKSHPGWGRQGQVAASAGSFGHPPHCSRSLPWQSAPYVRMKGFEFFSLRTVATVPAGVPWPRAGMTGRSRGVPTLAGGMLEREGRRRCWSQSRSRLRLRSIGRRSHGTMRCVFGARNN